MSKLSSNNKPMRRLRSYVCRNGRMTEGQVRAQETLGGHFGLQIENGALNYAQTFGREAPCLLEIGFGMGQSLLALAKSRPELNLIGVETHKPGIGALFLGMELEGLNNIRVFRADIIDVFAQCIPDESLDGVQIFFPDPWPKRRHHIRRLVQAEFIRAVAQKLKSRGTLHLATDWDDYARHMLRVISNEPAFTNAAGINNFAERSCYRPIKTKFERRAEREGRQIWELQFYKSC